MDNFLKKIGEYKVFSKEEELRLFRCFKKGNKKSFETIVNHNIKLVVSISKKYRNVAGAELDDLIQEGTIGLMKAIERFEFEKGFKFSSYATYWIKQTIMLYISNNKHLVRQPVYIHDSITKIKKFCKDFKDEKGEEPTLSEISKGTNFTKNKVEVFIELGNFSMKSMESELAEGMNLYDILKDNSTPFDEIFITKLENEELKEKVKELKARDLEVITYRFGLFNEERMTLQKISEKIGLTRERVRQIEKQTLKKLKLKFK